MTRLVASIYRLFARPARLLHRALMSRLTLLYLKGKGVSVGPRLRMLSFPLVRKHAKAVIRIGPDADIRNKLAENVVGIVNRSVLVACNPGARLICGHHLRMSGAIFHCSREIVVGDYVTIGIGAKIYNSDFHPLGALDRRENRLDKIPCAPIRIEDDVWIGAYSMILKGVTIGARSIVGAGAVVTKDIPPDSIAVGVPARVVRSIPAQSDQGASPDGPSRQ